MIMTCQAFIMTKNVKVSGFVVDPGKLVFVVI